MSSLGSRGRDGKQVIVARGWGGFSSLIKKKDEEKKGLQVL